MSSAKVFFKGDRDAAVREFAADTTEWAMLCRTLASLEPADRQRISTIQFFGDDGVAKSVYEVGPFRGAVGRSRLAASVGVK
jgi:hypothetical protein